MTSSALGVLLLTLACAANAQAGLDGIYRPSGAAGGTPVELRVEQAIDGWTATFNGESRPMRQVREDDLGVLFQDFDARAAHLQCAASDTLLLCRVDRGSRFAAQSFTAATGYFAIIKQGAAFELLREPLSSAVKAGS